MKDIRIVALQASFVFVGEYTLSEDGKWIKLERPLNVRRWGTSAGLGELAMKGPLSESALDPSGTVEAPLNAVLFTIRCDAGNWEGKLA